MRKKGLLAVLFAAMLLTGCGNDELPQAEGSSAAETAVTTAAETETASTAPATEPDVSTASAADTAQQTAETQTTETDAPKQEQSADAKPKLTAVALTEALITGGNMHGADMTVSSKILNAGETAEVIGLDTDDCYTNNYIDFQIGDEPPYTGRLDQFALLPDEAYVASLSDDELKALAAALYYQYADQFRKFAWNGGPLNLEGTGETRETEPGMCYERLTPSHTYDDLMREMHKYFTADYIVSGTDKNEDIGFYMKEIDGCLWRVSGIGQVAIDTYVTTSGIRSRTDNEIVFDMSVTRDESFVQGGSAATTAETFIIALDDGMWKCKQVPFEWNMS